MKRILRNSIICPDGKILISRHQHDYQGYFDKNNRYFAVDGGTTYLRRVGVGYTENSVIDDGKFTTQREVCEWGKNYNKKGKLLKNTKWIKIKDLDTDHIWNILLKVKNISDFYKKLLTDEIIYREELILNEKSRKL